MSEGHLNGPAQMIRKDFIDNVATARATQDARLANDHSAVDVRCIAERILSKLLKAEVIRPSGTGEVVWFDVLADGYESDFIPVDGPEGALLQRLIEEDA